MTLRHGLLGSATLLRAQLSFGAAFTAEWAFTVAIGLVAFEAGGAVAVGVVGVVRLLPAALLGPVIAAYADRVPREHVLIASSGIRGVSTLLCAPVLWAGGPVWIVYVLAIVSTVAYTPYRASHSALVPSLCRTPEELAAVNVVRGALDSLSVIVGPLVAALLVAVADLASVLVFAGACGLVSALLLLRLRYERIPQPTVQRRNLLTEVGGGLQAVRSLPGLSTVFGFAMAQTFVRGAFNVFVVVVAIDLLHRSDSTVGVLQGVVGVGAIIGSAVCTMLVASRAMARWLGVSIALWGAPLLILGLLPYYVVALLAGAVIGLGNSLLDVTGFTLMARMTPDAVVARVFGVFESLVALSVGAGSLVTPPLISLLGLRGALVAVGCVTPIVTIVWWRTLTRIDGSVAVRTDAIHLLREVPMLRPLPVPVIEQLAHGLDRRVLDPGEAVFTAGQPGDSFYVVEEGNVEVLDGPAVVRTMGRGQGFGEIALLGDTTRTMTVRAVGHATLFGIRRAFFVPAISGFGDARCAAESARRMYLTAAPGASHDRPDLDDA